jgi:ATP-dependent DNA helicase RecG
VLGTRQTGQLSFRMADLARDAHLLPAVQHVGEQMLARYPERAGRLIERWIGGAARYVNA